MAGSKRSTLLRIKFGGIGYEHDELVVSGRDRGAGMDSAPLLLAGDRGGRGLLGDRSNDVARNLGSSGYAVALLALALMPLVVVVTFVEEMRVAAPVSRERAASGGNLTPAGRGGGGQGPTLQEIPLTLTLAVERPNSWLVARAERVLPWVDGVWILGMLLFVALRAMGGWWQLEQVRRRARTLVPEDLERSFKHICNQVQVGRQVALRISSEVISPLTMGVWRATVILPVSAVLGLPMEELEAVLAHELGHIRRWDYVWNLMQTAVESVLFFHPSVWSLSRTVRERREICCDEIAVQSSAGATVYARALLRLEEQRTVQLRLAVALNGCNGSLLRRVKQVLGEGMAMESRMTSGVRVATAGTVVVALLLGPRITEAVATPIVGASKPVVARVLAALPEAIGLQRSLRGKGPIFEAPL